MSRQIYIGKLTLGGGAPVRVQSMTNTDTMDTRATVEQALRMVEAGCELVRITAPDVKAAENLGRIKEELLRRGCEVPLVADIHFNPKAAEVAATLVEKVRVNPGNYTDRNTGKLEFTLAHRHLQAPPHRHAHRHQPRLALRAHHVPLRQHP